jgi:SAM-dependent methyltransferase
VTSPNEPRSLERAILDGLRATGRDPASVTVDDLAAVDQLHSGGIRGTIELMRLAQLPRGSRVLDVGGGLGGPARVLARELDATVVVLDLAEEFCRTGERLTEWTGLSHLVSFRLGNALDMPFPDQSFDAVWMQNAGMTIADKPRLYREVWRMLRPGGRLALQEVVAGPVQPLHFPVVWATDASSSCLVPVGELRSLLTAAGFAEIAWIDITESLDAARRRRGSAEPSATLPPLGLHLVLGEELYWRTRAAGDRNLAERRVAYIRAAVQRPVDARTA